MSQKPNVCRCEGRSWEQHKGHPGPLHGFQADFLSFVFFWLQVPGIDHFNFQVKKGLPSTLPLERVLSRKSGRGEGAISPALLTLMPQKERDLVLRAPLLSSIWKQESRKHCSMTELPDVPVCLYLGSRDRDTRVL